MIKKNKLAPSFKIPSSNNKEFELKKIKNKFLVIYFYPKDNTLGCTNEAKDFSKFYKEFNKLNCEIIGVSKDTIESHKKFINKFKIPFQLLSDEKNIMLKKYGAWGEKSMYGKKFMGIKRTTVLIDPKGKIIKIWNNVKVTDHAKEVLNFLKEVI
jgi:peroxiredoxin Q/BCP